MAEKEIMPDLLTEEQLKEFGSVQLVARLMGAVKEYTNGLALRGLTNVYVSEEKINRWYDIQRQLEKELLSRLPPE